MVTQKGLRAAQEAQRTASRKTFQKRSAGGTAGTAPSALRSGGTVMPHANKKT